MLRPTLWQFCSKAGDARRPSLARKRAWKGTEDPNAIGREPEHIRLFSGQAERHASANLVGVLPKEIEFVNEYSAYIPTTSGAADLTRSLLAYLPRPVSRDTFKAAGVMP
jgi:hypothetical protein